MVFAEEAVRVKAEKNIELISDETKEITRTRP